MGISCIFCQVSQLPPGARPGHAGSAVHGRAAESDCGALRGVLQGRETEGWSNCNMAILNVAMEK